MKVKVVGGLFEFIIDKNVCIIVFLGCFMNDIGVYFKVNFGKCQDNDFIEIFVVYYFYFIISDYIMQID